MCVRFGIPGPPSCTRDSHRNMALFHFTTRYQNAFLDRYPLQEGKTASGGVKQIVFMVKAIPPHTMRGREQNGLPCHCESSAGEMFLNSSHKNLDTKRTSLLSSFRDLCQVFSSRSILASVCRYISVGLTAASFLSVDRSLQLLFRTSKSRTSWFYCCCYHLARMQYRHSLFVWMYAPVYNFLLYAQWHFY